MGSPKNRSRWTWQVADNKPLEGLLFAYIGNHSLYGQKELVLKAVRAFYAPLACLEDRNISLAEKQEIYKSAKDTLLRQIDILDTVYGNSVQLAVTSTDNLAPPSPVTSVAMPQLSFSALME
jgi:hypothetical protein